MEQNYFLAKWLNSEITEEELLKHISEEELRSYKKIIAATNRFKVPNFNAEETLEKIKSLHQSKSKVKKINFLKYTYRVVAMLAILFSSYYFISNKNTNYKTQLAEKINFELPDNSKVALNADSEISFKANKWNKKRELNLKGEAYFSVKKGSKFTVNTNLGSVSVLGTRFNVQARDAYFEVFCYKGLVSVNYNHKTIKVPAGTSFKVLNSTAEFSNSITETNPSWLKNNSSFTSVPYSYIIKELERQYNIEVTYNNSLGNTLFTGTFTHTNLKTALKAICIPLNLNFTILGDNKVSITMQ
ncbi:MAG: FecR family protein [Lutibacter sp.]|uniref:FecR family protein n=1 Tax=Lutibacter sp. TaxID=1925666 RepID=UPI0038598F80